MQSTINFQSVIHQLRSHATAAAFHDPTQQAEGALSRWKDEPTHERHPDLKVHTNRPFNAEPPAGSLCQMITPATQHYRRTHGPVPLVDVDTYTFSVGFEEGKKVQLSVADIKKLPKRTICSTMMCTGNRRGEFNRYGDTAGLPWENGSISTAEWTGTSFVDILASLCGINVNNIKEHGACFVSFWGGDGYHISVPVAKVLHEQGEAMMVYQMNGEVLPRDHGFPLRMVVPGFVGARSVKWIKKIVLTHEEVKGNHQRGIAYKQLGPNIKNLEEIKKSYIENEVPPIDQVPVTSAICLPKSGSMLDRQQESVLVQGYAYSGGGRSVFRVDVSGDGGNNWTQAQLTRRPEQPIRCNSAWAWVQWKAVLPLATGNTMTLVCKAIDDQYNQQPDTISSIWNLRGILNTSWGRSIINISN